MFKLRQSILLKKCGERVFILLRRALLLCRFRKGCIEFKFSISICIMLLFFVSDIYQFYKKLTIKDFANIAYTSCLNFFHTNSMLSPWQFGVHYALACYWVKRINNNSYQLQHCYGTTIGISQAEINQESKNIETKTLSQIEAAHPDLVCSKDEDEQVLIEVIYRKDSGFDKKKIGFFILESKESKPAMDNYSNKEFIFIWLLLRNLDYFLEKMRISRFYC